MFGLFNKKIYFSGVLITLLLLSGCSSGGGSSDSATDTTTGTTTSSGGAIDGYLQGARVFADTTGEGEFNSTEPNVLTDTNGDFTLTGTIADGTKVYASGGVDLSTGYAFEGRLSTVYAASRQPVILSPLTTFVTAVMDNDASASFDSASEVVATNLGLDPADVNRDPMTQVDLFLAAQKLQKTVEVIAAAKGGSDFNTAYEDVFSSLATVTASGGGVFNASDLVAQVQTDGAGIDSGVATAVSTFLDTYVATVDEMQAQSVSLDDLDTYGEVLNTYTEVVEGALDSDDSVVDIIAFVEDTQTTLDDMNVTQTAEDIASDTYTDPLIDALAEVESAISTVSIGTTLTDITANLTLTDATVSPFDSNDLNLTWSSDNPAISIDGTVVRDDTVDIAVVLKAKVENSLVSQTKIYNLVVKRNEIAPVAPNGVITLDEDAAAVTLLPGVSDANGDTPIITSVSTPSKGTVTVVATALGETLSYLPNENENGSDSFTYTVTDDTGLTATGTITVTINAVDDPTIWVTPTTLAPVYEDFITYTIPLEATDVDGPVTYDVVSTTGIVTASVSGSTLSISATANSSGIETIVVSATQNSVTVERSLSLTVNAVNDITIWDTPVVPSAVDEDSGSITVTLSATDVDGTPTYALVSTTGLTTASVSGSTLTITPVANANGNETIIVSASEGGQSVEYTINLVINAIDDATVWNTPTTIPAVEEDFAEFTIDLNATDVDAEVSYSFVSATGVTADVSGSSLNITAIENFNGSASVTVAASEGGVSLNHTISFDVTAIDDIAVWNTPATIAAVDEDFTAFTLDLNATDVDNSVSYTLVAATGVSASVSGSVLSLTAIENANGTASITVSANAVERVFTMIVNPVDDATVWNTPVTLTAVDEDFSAFTVDLNATDVDSAVNYTLGTYSNGVEVSLNGNILSVTAIENANGTQSIEVLANGESRVFSLLVNAVNDLATAEDGTINILKNTHYVGTLNATDPDTGDTLTFSIVDQTSANGTVNITDAATGAFTYDPTTDYVGTGSSFTYKVNDGTGDSNTATVVITVTEQVVPVTVLDDAITIDEDSGANIIDVGSNDINVSVITDVSTPSFGSVSISGTTIIYTPDADIFGTDTFTYTAESTSGETGTATVTVSITSINDAPVISQISNVTVAEDSVYQDVVFVVQDDNANLIISAESSNPTIASVSVESNTTIRITPQENMNGTVTISLTADDGIESTLQEFLFIITAVDDAPIAHADSFTVEMNSNDNALNILDNDEEFDTETLSVSSCTAGTAGASIDTTVYPILYTPVQDVIGTDTFECTISDGISESTAEVTVTVSGNHAPSIVGGGSLTMSIGETLTLQVTGDDVDGDNLTYFVEGSVGVASISIDNSGLITVSATEVGDKTFGAWVEDNATTPLLSGTADFAITVIEALPSVNEGDFSNDARLTQGEYDAYLASTSEGIPLDVKMYGIWGSNTDENNVTTFEVDYNEFQSTGVFFMSDDNETAASHDADGIVSTAIVTDDLTGSEFAEIKLISIKDSVWLANEFGISMPDTALAYEVAILDFIENYDYGYYEAADWSTGSAVAYTSLDDMTASNAIIIQQEENYNRAIVFGESGNTVIEVDLTGIYSGGEAYVLNDNAGTWERITDPDGVDLIKVSIDPSVSGYDTQYPILALYDGSSVTSTVFHGEYSAANTGWYELYFNEIAKDILIEESVSFTLHLGSEIRQTIVPTIDDTAFAPITEATTLHFIEDINNDGSIADELEPYDVTFEMDGNGTIDWGSGDINPIVWTPISGSEIQFTETDASGDIWNYTVTAIVPDTGTIADSTYLNVVIDIDADAGNSLGETDDNTFLGQMTSPAQAPVLPAFDSSIDLQAFFDLGDTQSVTAIEGIAMWGIWAVDDMETMTFNTDSTITFDDQTGSPGTVAYTVVDTDATYGTYMNISDAKIKYGGEVSQADLSIMFPDIPFSASAVGYKVAYLNNATMFDVWDSAFAATSHASLVDAIEYIQAANFTDGSDGDTFITGNGSDAMLFATGTVGTDTSGDVVRASDGTSVVGTWSLIDIDGPSDTIYVIDTSGEFENIALKVELGSVTRGDVEFVDEGFKEIQFNTVAKDDILAYMNP